MRFLLGLLCVLLGTATMAQVPNVFQSGQTASAAEVNENFSDLDTRSGALEATTSMQDARITDLEATVAALLDIVDPQPPVGDTVFVDGVVIGSIFHAPNCSACGPLTVNPISPTQREVVLLIDGVEVDIVWDWKTDVLTAVGGFEVFNAEGSCSGGLTNNLGLEPVLVSSTASGGVPFLVGFGGPSPTWHFAYPNSIQRFPPGAHGTSESLPNGTCGGDHFADNGINEVLFLEVPDPNTWVIQ